jgi:hypothetical protein
LEEKKRTNVTTIKKGGKKNVNPLYAAYHQTSSEHDLAWDKRILKCKYDEILELHSGNLLLKVDTERFCPP